MSLSLILAILACCLFLCLSLVVLLLVLFRRKHSQDNSPMDLALQPGYIFENSVEAILIADDHFQIITANRAAEQLLDTGSLPGKHLTDLFTPDSRLPLLGQPTDAEEPVFLRALTLSNGKDVSCSFGRASSRRDKKPIFILYLHEVTEIKEALAKLDQLANCDELTGLHNRHYFNGQLNQWIERYELSHQDFVLFFMDLTNFKYINDTFGHTAGDEALRAVAEALKAVIEPGDELGRFSGDEFVILHPAENWESMAVRIRHALNGIDCSSFAPGFQMDAGIGHCLYSEADSVTSLFKIADLRMYTDKSRERELTGVANLRQAFADYASSNVLDNDLFNAFAGASNHVYIYICDMRTDMSRWSANAVAYFGMPGEYMEAAGDIWIKHIHPDDQALYAAGMEDIMSGAEHLHKMEYRARNAQGEYVWLECRGRTVLDQDGHPKIFAGMMTRLDARNKYDPLTRLKTMSEFSQYDFSGKRGTILLLGLDKFRSVVNTFGYSFGDVVLSQFAKRTVDYLGTARNVFRMEGDEFLIISPDATKEQTQQLFHDLRRLTVDLGNEDHSVTLGFSAGCVVYPDDGTTRETLLRNLEHSLEFAKLNDRGALVCFSQRIAERHNASMAQHTLITQAIQNGFKNFTLYYQPLVTTTDHRIVGCEALLRWTDPNGTTIPTDELIQHLESDRSINMVGQWVADQAMAQAKVWQDRYGDLALGFNVSYLQFRYRDFASTLIQMAQAHQVDPQLISIELTESCAVDKVSALAESFHRLRAHGFRISLDDFGIGYSTLLTLRDLPVDSVKIDHTFVCELTPENTTDLAIVNSVTSLAHQLGLKVVLEGVENKQVLDLVTPFSVDFYQGFYLAKPMPAEEFEAMLRKERL